MSNCRDSISALVGACLSSRRDFIRFALAGSSLPFMRSQGLGSSLANDRARWYRDAKFGMFIHWEPYSLASVEASWPIMTPMPGGISEAEYRQLPRRFNPSKFDANHLIDLAKAAGQQYMVFTTKHHDGFCMTEGQLQIDLPQHPPDSNVTVVAVRTL